MEYLIHVEVAINNLINTITGKLFTEVLYETQLQLVSYSADIFNTVFAAIDFF